LFIRAHLPKADGADARIGRMRLDSMSARSKSVNVLPGPAGDSIFGAPRCTWCDSKANTADESDAFQ
jgi:hypothetical protein